jgi:hypothetical protein
MVWLVSVGVIGFSSVKQKTGQQSLEGLLAG